MWAVAEISWQDPAGKPVRERATLEDTSHSGACLRLKAPVQIGSRVHIKWHREQFSAVARNCRRDGRDFLLGVLREPANTKPQAAAKTVDPSPTPAFTRDPESQQERTQAIPSAQQAPMINASAAERKPMESKTLFPKLWRGTPANDGSAKSKPTEVTVNKPSHVADAIPASKTELLSYDDIYRAAGILNPPSGYGIQKVVDMLNSERLRDLSKDIKRVSVLMALDAAATPIDDLLQDATRRQRALDSYEAGRRQQLETFESRKAEENAQIEAELERIRAHYAERIQRNREQVQQEKEALRNWQMAMQHETQRIQEVMELCKAAAGAGQATTAVKTTTPSNT